MPCMKCTSAAVNTAPAGIVTGAAMSAIDCCTTGLSAALLVVHAKRPVSTRPKANLLGVTMGTVVWDQRDTIRAGPAVRHGFRSPANFSYAESRSTPFPKHPPAPVAGRHRGARRPVLRRRVGDHRGARRWTVSGRSLGDARPRALLRRAVRAADPVARLAVLSERS